MDNIVDKISIINPEALTADGFDDSIIGISSSHTVIYSADSIVETLMRRDGMSHEDALEFFEYNIAGAYVGEFTPIYMWNIE